MPSWDETRQFASCISGLVASAACSNWMKILEQRSLLQMAEITTVSFLPSIFTPMEFQALKLCDFGPKMLQLIPADIQHVNNALQKQIYKPRDIQGEGSFLFYVKVRNLVQPAHLDLLPVHTTQAYILKSIHFVLTCVSTRGLLD